MHNLLSCLHEKLGLELDPDEPALMINDNVTVYFDTEEEGLVTLNCPIMTLPDDSETLKKILQLNYYGPVRLSTDNDNTVLVAVHSIETESTNELILSTLETFINAVFYIYDTLVLDSPSSDPLFIKEINSETPVHLLEQLTRRSKMP